MIVTQSGKDPKKEIIEWARTATEGYYDVSITDLTTSWTDGLAFSALIHRHRPDLIDITRLDKNKPIENMHYAFQVAQEELYVMSLLEPEGKSVQGSTQDLAFVFRLGKGCIRREVHHDVSLDAKASSARAALRLLLV